MLAMPRNMYLQSYLTYKWNTSQCKALVINPRHRAHHPLKAPDRHTCEVWHPSSAVHERLCLAGRGPAGGPLRPTSFLSATHRRMAAQQGCSPCGTSIGLTAPR